MTDISILERIQNILVNLQKCDVEYSALMDVSPIKLTTFPFNHIAVNLVSTQTSIEAILKRYRSINNLECEEVQIMFKIITMCDILKTRLNILYERLNTLDDIVLK